MTSEIYETIRDRVEEFESHIYDDEDDILTGLIINDEGELERVE